ncbi:MAG: hypothetical protein FJX67_17650 [Alphaproteobacteria bacterium]|nr:hypothetical protein [Alphaproteobacteria bacterium]
MGAAASQGKDGRRPALRLGARLVLLLYLVAALLGHPVAFASLVGDGAPAHADCHAGAPATQPHEPTTFTPDGITHATGCCFLHAAGLPASGIAPLPDTLARAPTPLGSDDGRNGLTPTPPVEPPRRPA